MLQVEIKLLLFFPGKFGHYYTDPSITSITVNFSLFWLLVPYLTVEMISSGLLFPLVEGLEASGKMSVSMPGLFKISRFVRDSCNTAELLGLTTEMYY